MDNDEIDREGSVPGITSIGIDFDATARRLGEVLPQAISAPDEVISLQLYDSAHLVLRGSTRRFQRMCELLKTTDAKISAIINFSGYRSEAFPKRMFVRRTGMTMRAYRESSKRLT